MNNPVDQEPQIGPAANTPWNPRLEDWGIPRLTGTTGLGPVKLGRVWGCETVPIDQALGRVAAGEILSKIAVPRWPLSAIRGEGVSAANTSTASPNHPLQLTRNVDVAQWGHDGKVPSSLPDNEAWFAEPHHLLPHGVDAVVSDLSSAFAGERYAQKVRLRLIQPIEPGTNVIATGADMPVQHLLLREGERIKSATVAALVMAGVQEVEVINQPRIAVITLGGPVQPPGHQAQTGWLPDAMAPLVCSLLTQWMYQVTTLKYVADNLYDRVALNLLRETHDLVICVGMLSVDRCGLSKTWKVFTKVGDETLMPDVIHGDAHTYSERAGRYRPADVTAIDAKAYPEESCGMVVTMKGLPLSVLTSMYLVVRPVLDALSGMGVAPSNSMDEAFRFGSPVQPPESPPDTTPPEQGVRWFNGVLAAPAPRDPKRHWLQLAHFDHSEPGRVGLRVLPSEEYRVSTMLRAEAMVAIEKGEGDIPAGAPVQFFLLD